MSDTESEDEFLSADEGEDEISSKNDLQEEEVDEIMDILMNDKHKQISSEISEPQLNEVDKSVEESSIQKVVSVDHKIEDSKTSQKAISPKETSPKEISFKETSPKEIEGGSTINIEEIEKEKENEVEELEENENGECISKNTVEALVEQEGQSKHSEENNEKEKEDEEISNQSKNETKKNEKDNDVQANHPPIEDKINLAEINDNIKIQQENNLAEEEVPKSCLPIPANNDSKDILENKEEPNEKEHDQHQQKNKEKQNVSDKNHSEDEDTINMDSLDLDDNDENVETDHYVSENKTISEKNDESNVQQQDGYPTMEEVPNLTIGKNNQEISEKKDNPDVHDIENTSVDHEVTKDGGNSYGNFPVDSSNEIETTNKHANDTLNTENEDKTEENVDIINDSVVLLDNNEHFEIMQVKKEKQSSDSCSKNETDNDNGKSNEHNSEKLNDPSNDDESGWGWDDWADDFITQAAGKVSTLLETVEGQFGIPDPKAMARIVTKEEKQFLDNQKTESLETTGETKTHDKESTVPVKTPVEPQKPNPLDRLAEATDNYSGVSSWFSGFSAVSTITGLVQNTGTDLMSGGIDALEFIGKKTVDILSEGDPGLRTKRDILAGKKGNTLSAALKEAKMKSEQEHQVSSSSSQEMKFVDFFEKYQGNAHLDALEMLSSECDSKLTRILNIQSTAIKEESTKIMSEVRNKFELNEDFDEQESESKDFKKELFAATKRLKLKVTCSKVLNTWTKLKDNSKNMLEMESPKVCCDQAIASLAELLSRFIEYQRKVADMLMLTDMQAKELPIVRASALKYIAELFALELTLIANGFAQNIVDKKSDSITDIYLEGSNCVSMVKDCHLLLLPILQCSTVK